MTDALVPHVLPPGGGKTIEGSSGGPLTFKVRGEETGGSLTVLENAIAPRHGPRLHLHRNEDEDEDESWYVIEGTLEFELGGERAIASAGIFVFFPRGTPHRFRNAGDSEVRILVLFTTSGTEAFSTRFAAIPADEAGPAAFSDAGAPASMEVLGLPLSADAPPRNAA